MQIADYLDEHHHRLLRPSGGCDTCPRRRVDFVPATLNSGKVLFLGEAPGATEVEEQEGFTGASGNLLRRVCEEANVEKPWSFSNTIHCRPPNNANPKPKEIECCLSQFVLDEIRGYDWVVMCGTVPLKALFPGAKGSNYRGNVARHPDFPDQKFYAVWHPAYILRRRDMRPSFERQIARLARLVRGDDDLAYNLYTGGGEEFSRTLERILSGRLLCVDVETNQKLESWHADARIVSVAVSDGTDVCFVHESEPHFLGTLLKIRTYLETPGKQVVNHNTGFDLDFLERELDFKIKTYAIHDTATIWYEAAQYQMPGLKELAAEEGKGYRNLAYRPGHTTDVGVLARYNAEDVIHPVHLMREGLRRVKPKTRDLLTRVSGPAGYVLRKIESNGIYLRQDYWRAKTEEYEEKRNRIVNAWREVDPAFIPKEYEAGDGLKKYLFDVRGYPILARTESGEPSTDKTAIKGLIRDHGAQELKFLLALRKVDKMLTTYLRSYEKHVDVDGRIHSSFTNTWTDTGRTSSRSPNLQNIPRLKEIRDLFGPTPGGILMESDFSQIEFRIMVCLAGDRNGIQAYRDGIDAHTATARSFCAGDEPTKQERTWAKVINFALCYGGDAYKVQQWARDQYGLSWTLQQAEKFVRTFFATYPQLGEFHHNCGVEFTQNEGWFESVTGHVFYYRDWDSPNQGKRDHAYRSQLNSRAQGPAAQICFLTMIHADRLLHERNLGAVKMVNHVHDSIIYDIPDASMVPDVVQATEDAKDIAYEWVKDWFPVPLVLEHEVGPAWGSLEEWES